MNQTLSGTDNGGAVEQDSYVRRWNRVHELREKLKSLSMGNFTFGELGSAMRLLGLACDSSGPALYTDEDLEILTETGIAIQDEANVALLIE